jgi:hypothetical protein
MMSLAGVSRAVVPALADCPTALLAAPDVGAGAAAAFPAIADPADELLELAELPEQPASNIPPASMAPPIVRPAAAPNLVRADRRFKLSMFCMPL